MVEAKRRDHRVLGKKLDLFSLQEDAGGGLVSSLLLLPLLAVLFIGVDEIPNKITRRCRAGPIGHGACVQCGTGPRYNVWRDRGLQVWGCLFVACGGEPHSTVMTRSIFWRAFDALRATRKSAVHPSCVSAVMLCSP